MRLIDADALLKHFETIQEQENAIGLDFVAITDEIKEQPTAYDPDKVVEQLEKEFKKYYGKNWNKVPYLVKVIEIVQGSEARDVVTR